MRPLDPQRFADCMQYDKDRAIARFLLCHVLRFDVLLRAGCRQGCRQLWGGLWNYMGAKHSNVATSYGIHRVLLRY